MNTKMINVILRLLKAVNLVVVVVVNVVDVALLVVTGHRVCTVIFMSNPTTVLRLCCGCVVLLLGL